MSFIRKKNKPVPTTYFEKEELWDGRIIKDPWHIEKFRIMHAMIPADVKKILDIGCGDGTLLFSIRDRYDCFGIDLSFQALKHVAYPVSQASIDDLPIKKKVLI